MQTQDMFTPRFELVAAVARVPIGEMIRNPSDLKMPGEVADVSCTRSVRGLTSSATYAVPGAIPSQVYGNIAARGVKGIVLEAFGVGNM